MYGQRESVKQDNSLPDCFSFYWNNIAGDGKTG